MSMTPSDWLVKYGRLYPQAWRQADEFRRDRGQSGILPDWPPWCFVPLGGWYAIISAHIGKDRLGLDDIQRLQPLAALGAWRYTQGIYRFHSAVLDALSDTVPSGELPVDVLLRLPEWCVYVETPGMAYLGHAPDGFFAFLESDAEAGRAELRIVTHAGDDIATAAPVHLGPWTVTEAVDRARQVAQKQAPDYAPILTDDMVEGVARGISPVISLLLYLCSDEPEIAGHVPGVYPQRPQLKKTKMGWRLFPPDKPRIWRIGEETGERLRQAAESPPRHGTGESAPRRAHIRRAHWHGYWTGPRKPRPDIPEEQQRRRFSYRWLHPMLVGGDDG